MLLLCEQWSPVVTRSNWHHQMGLFFLVPVKISFPFLTVGWLPSFSLCPLCSLDRSCPRATLSMQHALRMVCPFQVYWGNVAEIHNVILHLHHGLILEAFLQNDSYKKTLPWLCVACTCKGSNTASVVYMSDACLGNVGRYLSGIAGILCVNITCSGILIILGHSAFELF